MTSARIVLLARAPSALDNTRLTADMPPDAGTALRHALLLDTFDAIRDLGIPIQVSFSPVSARPDFAWVGGGAVLVPQRGKDRGACMHAAITDAFKAGASHVVLVGSDVPTLPPDHVRDAFMLLESGVDVVLGPSEDGGCYLIGVTRGDDEPELEASRLRPLFSEIEWRSSAVLDQMLGAARALGAMTALVRPWFDVDYPTDLAQVAADPRPEVARYTRLWISTAPFRA